MIEDEGTGRILLLKFNPLEKGDNNKLQLTLTSMYLTVIIASPGKKPLKQIEYSGLLKDASDTTKHIRCPNRNNTL